MIRVFFGENRVAAEKEIRRVFGDEYEVIEGEVLKAEDLPGIFQGATLFAMLDGGALSDGGARKIVVKGASENSEVWGLIPNFVETAGNEVILWEMKLDKRLAGYKALKEAGIEMREFPLAEPPEAKLVFGIFDTALRDGAAAVKEVRKIEMTQDPFMFFGLLVTQALRRYENMKGGARERRILKVMAEVDMQMKSSTAEPWRLIEALLVRIGAC